MQKKVSHYRIVTMKKNQKTGWYPPGGIKTPNFLKIALLSLIFLIFPGILFAQNSINAAGGKAAGNGGTVSYTLGQVADQTHTGTNGTVSEGVQQAYEIYVLTGLDDVRQIELRMTAYPNPVTEFLVLKVSGEFLEKLTYRLFDVQGSLLKSEDITGAETRILMNDLVPAAYLLRVYPSGDYRNGSTDLIKSFKIIKH